MTKYMQCYTDMRSEYKELFDDFKKIHDAYMQDPEKNKERFNEKGEEVVAIIRRYERVLCGHSEAGRFGKFSANLAEKFWEIVRRDFPRIDFIGVK